MSLRFRRQKRVFTSWVVVLNILAYPLLTFLATPIAHARDDGRWVVLCTLQGVKSIYVSAEGKIAQSAPEETCPALQLLHLVGSATCIAPPPLPVGMLYVLGMVDRLHVYAYLAPHISVYPPRAPPAV